MNPFRWMALAIWRRYSWLHLGLSLAGNVTFLVGSLLFLPVYEPWKQIGVWLFIAGALGMAIGSFGRLLVDIYDHEHDRHAHGRL